MDDQRLTARPTPPPPFTDAEPWPQESSPEPAPQAGPPDLSLPAWRLVLGLAWPALVQQLLVLVVSLSDRLLAGRYQTLGSAQQVATQAAQTTAGYLAWFISSYSVLVNVGSTALVARFIGA